MKNKKDKNTILFNGTAKEIEPHFEDLAKRYKTVVEAVEDLNPMFLPKEVVDDLGEKDV